MLKIRILTRSISLFAIQPQPNNAECILPVKFYLGRGSRESAGVGPGILMGSLI